MDFSGMEKLSLLDFDDNITCTLFFAGCNMRCPFCHNSALVIPGMKPQFIPWQDIKDFLEKRKNVLDAVCVSGGECTLMPDLLEKLGEIKALGYKVKLDTNGSRPEILKIAVEQGLVDYVAMDIKNSKEKYAKTIGVDNVDIKDIEESVDYLMHTDLVDYEFRTTIIEEFHETEDIEKISLWLAGAKRHFLQQYVDRDGCIEHGFHPVPKEKALIWKAILDKNIEKVELRGYE